MTSHTTYKRHRAPSSLHLVPLLMIGASFAFGVLLGLLSVLAEPEKPTKTITTVTAVTLPAVVEEDEPLLSRTFAPVEPVEPAEPTTEAEPERLYMGEFGITHYCPCEKCCGKWALNRPDGIVYTASGTVAEQGRTIAVDPSKIPYGTELLVVYEDGREVTYVAEDCGGAIKGNRIDVYMDSHEAALQAGVHTAEVYIVKEANT